jgi:hypothetical protein
MHWQHILQVLVPTFSAFSVAQGYVSSDPSGSGGGKDTPLGVSFDEAELEGHGEEAERKRRMEEERRGRMCPICLSKPVAGRMTKCGHVRCEVIYRFGIPLTSQTDLLLSLCPALHPAIGHSQVGKMPDLRRYGARGYAQVCQVPRRYHHARFGTRRG